MADLQTTDKKGSNAARGAAQKAEINAPIAGEKVRLRMNRMPGCGGSYRLVAGPLNPGGEVLFREDVGLEQYVTPEQAEYLLALPQGSYTDHNNNARQYDRFTRVFDKK